MVGSRFRQVEELFHEARSLPATDRAAYLDEACGADLDLRHEVESLLTHSDDGTSAMRLRPDGEDGTDRATIVDRGPVSEGPGTRIGPYKILQQIGEGGFGVVYMAEQTEPVTRKVALKIIKLGMDTRQVIARFEAERQALALMDHPNIAKVLEAGATETGRPYFVMELVRGIPIIDYCDKAKLSTRQRLELFMQVCDAVQHAHQKGVIHRDLKPSNVLVTLHDTRAVPKVIDFGIAKATSHRLTEKTLFTEFRYFIGTPEYMSPDQAEISGLDVDTRTDIYSLGVLLYEMLTGTTPFDPQTLRGAGYGEIQRIICEVDPPKPSTRLDTLLRSGSEIGRLHGTESGSLSRLMRGDLDWIVMKAMEKDRTRRYQSAGEFSADIHRYLDGQPVLAGPPSVTYKLRKFVSRHRLGVTAAALIAAALVIGFSAATAGFVRASREAQRSRQIAGFLQDLFVSTDPDRAVAGEADVGGVLATAREVFGEDHATVAATLSSRALQLQSAGNLEAAEKLYRESLALWREQPGDTDANVAYTLGKLGMLLVTKGDDAAAEEALRESVELSRAQPGGMDISGCDSLAVLAGSLVNQARFQEASELMRESIRIRRQHAPQQRIQIAISLNQLVNISAMAGDDEATAEGVAELIQAWRDALPQGGPFLAKILADVAARWYVPRDEHEQAEPLLREALEIFHAHDEPPNLHYAMAVRGLYNVLEDRGDLVEAVPLGVERVEIARDFEGGRHFDDAVKDLGNLGWRIAREPGRSEADYRAALTAIEGALAEKPDSPPFLNTLGVVKYRLGKYDEALETLALSHAYYSQEIEGGAPCDLAFIAMSNYRLGKEPEARSAFIRLRKTMQDPECAASEDNRLHLEEAEALLGHLVADEGSADA